MRKIFLSGEKGKGKYALVDDEDYDYLTQWRWHLGSGGYARRNYWEIGPNGDRISKTELMHRTILNLIGFWNIADHRNGSKLDNRKKNLRRCTHKENSCNRKFSNIGSTSKYKGVHFHKASNKWQSLIGASNIKIYLGVFDTQKQAALAYNEAAIKYHGEFASFNEVL